MTRFVLIGTMKNRFEQHYFQSVSTLSETLGVIDIDRICNPNDLRSV